MMCDYGNQVILSVPIPGDLSFEGVDVWKDKPIDSCIAPIVKALNDAGIYTVASCCGHGKGGGSIVLWDDREMVLRPTDEFVQVKRTGEMRAALLRRVLNSAQLPTKLRADIDRHLDGPEPWNPTMAGPLLRKSREMEKRRIHG